jgi:hypothetical protein
MSLVPIIKLFEDEVQRHLKFSADEWRHYIDQLSFLDSMTLLGWFGNERFRTKLLNSLDPYLVYKLLKRMEPYLRGKSLNNMTEKQRLHVVEKMPSGKQKRLALTYVERWQEL